MDFCITSRTVTLPSGISEQWRQLFHCAAVGLGGVRGPLLLAGCGDGLRDPFFTGLRDWREWCEVPSSFLELRRDDPSLIGLLDRLFTGLWERLSRRVLPSLSGLRDRLGRFFDTLRDGLLWCGLPGGVCGPLLEACCFDKLLDRLFTGLCERLLRRELLSLMGLRDRFDCFFVMLRDRDLDTDLLKQQWNNKKLTSNDRKSE